MNAHYVNDFSAMMPPLKAPCVVRLSTVVHNSIYGNGYRCNVQLLVVTIATT
jgi:hypothetical protein